MAALLALSGAALAQSLSLAGAVQQATANSPEMAASRQRVAAAEEEVRRASHAPNPQLELAPGIGFTNSNALLWQRIDIGGVTRANTRLAKAQLSEAEAAHTAATSRLVSSVRTAYAAHAQALQSERSIREGMALVGQLLVAVRERVRIGEAPQVQITRTEIEQARLEQEQVLAAARVDSTRRALNRIIGNPPEAPLTLSDAVAPTRQQGSVEDLIRLALSRRHEVLTARTHRDTVSAEREVARAGRRPTLTGAVAADIWSLDRRPFRSENLGLQVALTIPLFNGGAARAEDRRFEALLNAASQDTLVAERLISTEVERAYADLQARMTVAANYESNILPKGAQLVRVLQAGFENGVSTILEVLDAQRVLRQTQQEHLDALFQAIEAENALYRATGAATDLQGLPK